MSFTALQIQQDPAVAHLYWLTLNRPEARNAYSEAMVGELTAALNELEANEDVWCVALTGAGRSFSAGGDLKQMRDHSGMFAGDAVQLRSNYLRGIHSIPRRLARFDKPIIAAVNGAAIGAGLDLACMCDLRIASEHAKLGSTFVKLGLVPGDGGAYFLARTIGLPRAMELILTGRVLSAAQALELGLVHEVVAGEQLTERTRAVAAEICANGPLAVRLAKSAALRSWDLPMHAALELAATYQGIAQNTADHDEAVSAFLDKRSPTFRGK